MLLNRAPGWRTAGIAVAVPAVLALAFFLRQGTFWTPHTEPVELAYVTLAMKMGTHEGLKGYHMSGIQIRHTEVPRIDGGRPLSIAFPLTADSSAEPSFVTWPHDQDSNPFHYKPPFFPSLLTYGHHQLLGPKVMFYPILAPDPFSGSPIEKSKAAADLQAWAVLVPLMSGMLAVVLTLAVGWRMFGPAVGVLAAFWMAIHPAAILTSSRIWPEMTMTACLLISVFLFDRFTARRNWGGCVLAGAAYALAVLTDSAALFFLPAFWVWAFIVSRRLLNTFFGAFAFGTLLLSKTWFDYTHRSLGDFALRLADHPAAAPAGPVFYYVPWIVAAFSIICFIKNKPSSFRADPQKEHILVSWFFIVSALAAHGLIGHRLPWDERALAPILPFAAILASWVLCRTAASLVRRVSASR